jgi:hypothetical protein
MLINLRARRKFHRFMAINTMGKKRISSSRHKQRKFYFQKSFVRDVTDSRLRDVCVTQARAIIFKKSIKISRFFHRFFFIYFFCIFLQANLDASIVRIIFVRKSIKIFF